ncbi:MAG: hypothetical protein Q7R34_01560 [Dehalococcoidia bacterium]|nr:hypothetical protein [Dehalococcoidia bacterium]
MKKQQQSLFPDEAPQLKKLLPLAEAQAVAEELRKELEQYCLDIVVAGSIRRRRPVVHDIDMVCLPENLIKFILKLKAMDCSYGGKKLARFVYKEVQVDLYFATPQTMATLVLIRTGSAQNNIRLCTIARNNGMKLHADGSGLFRIEAQGCEGREVLIARTSEKAIYESLGLPYQEPWERN